MLPRLPNEPADTMQVGLKKYGSSYSFGGDDNTTAVDIKLQALASSSTSTFYKSTDALQRFKYYEDEESLRKSPSRIRAWKTVAGAWLIQFCGFGYTNAFGIYEDFYVREFLMKSTSSQISWIGSVQFFLLMSFGVFSGRLFDKGYFYHLLISGSCLFVFCLFMLSLAQPGRFYQIFLSQGLGVGIAAGLIHVPSIAILAQHFPDPHHRARAMALVASGSSVGGILHPIMLNNLLHGRFGFHNGVRASAGVIGGCLLLACLLMRPKYPRFQENKSAVKASELLRKFVKDRAYVIAVLGLSLSMLGAFMPVFYLQLYSILHGINTTFSFYTLTIFNGASLFGRILPGLISKRVGVINVMLVCVIAVTALLFGLLGVKSLASVAVFSVHYGFFTGAYLSMMNPMLAVLCDQPEELGARMGFAFIFTGLSCLIGPPINGALLSDEYVWWKSIVFSGVVTFVGTVAFFILRLILWHHKDHSAKLII